MNLWFLHVGSWQELLIGLAIRVFIILFILPVHEFAHGWAANKLGDPTAKMMGRLTLNPMAHIDWLGAGLLILLGFGWAKPVPVNPYNFKDRTHKKRGMALTALAGPVSNLLFALVGIIVLRLLLSFDIWHSQPVLDNVVTAFLTLAQINLSLAIFNLLPVYPLDGSRILGGILPDKFTNFIERNGRTASIIFIIIIFSGLLDGVLSFLISGCFNGMFRGVNWLFDLIGLESKVLFI